MLLASQDNKKVRDLKKLASSRAFLRETGLLFCEGDTLYRDALSYGARIDTVFFREGTEFPVPEGSGVYELTDRVFRLLSEVDTPQNVIFTARLPGEDTKILSGPALLLDGVSDPGNLGTILRTAVAFGIPVVIGEGSVDVTSPKVVRSAMGALFRAKICQGDLGKIIPAMIGAGIQVFAATLSERSVPLPETTLSGVSAVVGNEAHGVSERVRKLCSGEILIPMPGGAESLNAAVAASILMWEMSKTNQ